VGHQLPEKRLNLPERCVCGNIDCGARPIVEVLNRARQGDHWVLSRRGDDTSKVLQLLLCSRRCRFDLVQVLLARGDTCLQCGQWLR